MFTPGCFTDMNCSEARPGRIARGRPWGAPWGLVARSCLVVAWASQWVVVTATGASGSPDPGRLPSPADRAVDFLRDIRPILERSCIRCHGPERPRSGLRLDRREGVLRGGEGGPVVVGNSGASRLIHVVARLPDVPEDLWMPPDGQAPPLTQEEIALLRAWIDQGLPGETEPGRSTDRIEWTAGFGGWGGSGPLSLLRSRFQQPSGWNAGLEGLTWVHEPPDGLQWTLQVRALHGDARLQWDAYQPGWRWLHAGVQQYESFSPSHGSWPMEPGAPVGSLSLEPELEVGRSWWELALDRPGWPEIPLSYEHRYREGTRSLTSGSAAAEGAVRRLIWPAHQHIDEQMHLLRLRAGHEIGSWRLEDELRLQWTDFRTGRTNSSRVPPESDDRRLTRISEAHQSFQAANAFRFERRFRPWLRSTGGYLYSRYDADGTFQLWDSPLSPSATLLRRWRSPAVIVQQTTHAANANWVVEPGRGWSCLAGLQAEWTRQQGLGRAFLEYEWAPDDWLVLPASQEHARDRVVLSEFVGLRWTGRKPVTFYADLKAEQDSVDFVRGAMGRGRALSP